MSAHLILAPLRGVTIRCFRETFATEIAEAGFTEAVTPFISAIPGFDPLKDRELSDAGRSVIAPYPNEECVGRGRPPGGPQCCNAAASASAQLLLTPQFIGKDPGALRECLLRIRSAGFETADLNCGCPFPMVRNKGRGSGILRTPDILRQMLEVGCETMGPGKFSIKTRLGVDRTDELERLMPLINLFPLRRMTVHARTARQMYEGPCDWAAFGRIQAISKAPLVPNGDIEVPALPDAGRSVIAPCPNEACVGRGRPPASPFMIGRSFIRSLGARDDADDLALRYLDASATELCGDRPVLGRMKELLSYWKELPRWRRRWNVIKICRTTDELRSSLSSRSGI